MATDSGQRPVLWASLMKMIDPIADGIAKVAKPMMQRLSDLEVRANAVEQRLMKLEEQPTRDLEARIETLQAQPLRYLGVWAPTTRYEKGSFVSHQGSLWHADTITTGVRPGGNSGAWTLCVKRGSDAPRDRE